MITTLKKNLKFVGACSKQSVLDLITIESKKNLPIVLFAHGFKGFKDWGHFPQMANNLAEKGFCVVKFNFSHNGGSIEDPIDFPDLEAFSENTYSKELEDIGCILKWIETNKSKYFSNCDLSNISLIGHSRGGGISLLAAREYPQLKKIITWAAVADFKARLPKEDELSNWKEDGFLYIKNGRTNQDMPIKYSFVEDLYNNSERLSVKKAVQNTNQPFLIIHGENDETVPISDVEQIKSWRENIELVKVPNANHTFGGKHPFNEIELPDEMNLVLNKTVEFLNQI